MRRIKILRLISLAIEEMVVKSGLPDNSDAGNFIELVKIYAKDAMLDLTEEEVSDFMRRPLGELFPECNRGQ